MSAMVNKEAEKAAVEHSLGAFALHQASKYLRVARDKLTLAGASDLASEAMALASRADQRRRRLMRHPARKWGATS